MSDQTPLGNTEPQPAGPFVVPVPDYVLADWIRAKPHFESKKSQSGRPSIGGGLYWAILQSVINQRSASVVLPDVLLGQVYWGGQRESWPRNWRNNLLKRLKRQTGAEGLLVDAALDGSQRCQESCPLYGTAVKHRHFSVSIRTENDIEEVDRLDDEGQPEENAWLRNVFLGALEVCGFNGPEGRLYDFGLQTQRAELDEAKFKALTSRLNRFQRRGRLVSVYLPLRIFSGSQRLGLSFRQRQLMLAILRELTRNSRKSENKTKRDDNAALIQVNGKTQLATDIYPGLSANTRYVAFNGNGGFKRQHLRGHGYRMLGKGGWLVRARYVHPDDADKAWSILGDLIKDLKVVAELFGLVAAARHIRTGEWLGLADLPELLRNASGRRWLRMAFLRIYTEQDYCARWRKIIAQRIGFSCIPDSKQELPVSAQPWHSATKLLVYLRAHGISQTKLAAEMGVPRSRVNQYINGHKAWTLKWQERVRAWIEGVDRV
jgi:hypothetical protein